jgi:hypothetical protein
MGYMDNHNEYHIDNVGGIQHCMRPHYLRKLRYLVNFFLSELASIEAAMFEFTL